MTRPRLMLLALLLPLMPAAGAALAAEDQGLFEVEAFARPEDKRLFESYLKSADYADVLKKAVIGLNRTNAKACPPPKFTLKAYKPTLTPIGFDKAGKRPNTGSWTQTAQVEHCGSAQVMEIEIMTSPTFPPSGLILAKSK